MKGYREPLLNAHTVGGLAEPIGLADRERVVARKETPDVAHEDGALNWHTEPLLAALAHYLHAVLPASGNARKVIEAGGSVVFPACAGTPVNAGSASPAPSARDCPLS